MTELLTAAQMRAIEHAAIESGEVTGLELMERAGAGVVEAILAEWPAMAKAPQKAVVLCGPGNNGGDGFVVARLLKHRGWEVEVFLYGDEGKLPPDAKVNCERWREMGGILEGARRAVPRVGDIIVDALFGTGLCRRLSGAYESAVAAMAGGPLPVVSIDMPSGYCADSGARLGPLLRPRLCVTFEAPRVGHYLGDASDGIEKLSIVKIGLKKQLRDLDWKRDSQSPSVGTGFDVISTSSVSGNAFLGKNKLAPQPNKFTHGHALVLSGPSGKTGAARLAARGALRVGAGVVTVACPPEALVENAAQLNAIMLAPVADATALAAVLQDTRINALCLGPALGLDQHAQELVEAALDSGRKLVLDADALSMFKDEPEALFAMLHDAVVLTPHAGEFARLFPDIAERLAAPASKGPAYSKVDATREAAKRAGCVVLYKGADTVIADAHRRAVVNSAHYERSAPWLATAGSGDVLAGFITGLMARGFPPMQAAQTAAWLHVECALKFGPGLIAEDIPEQLPAVFADLDL